MKVRLGFVSNSSSSSFVCDFCGEKASGWDATLSDVGMVQCENGHVFCEEHLLGDIEIEDKRNFALSYEYISEEDKNKIRNMTDDEFEDYFYEEDDVRYEFEDNTPSKLCPLCNFKKMTNGDIKLYFLKKYNLTEEEIINNIKNEFKTYENFKKFIKNKKRKDNL